MTTTHAAVTVDRAAPDIRSEAPAREAGAHAAGHDMLLDALRSVGAATGSVLFVHVDLAALGGPETESERARRLLDALLEVVGAQGTLLVPTYTFSFCRGEVYDPATTPTRGGPWSPGAEFLELFRSQPGVIRSADPIHSVAGIGPRAPEFLHGVAGTCFGPGSVFDRLVDAGVLVLLVGLPLVEATVRHHTEERVGAPFRFRKLFTGTVRTSHGERRQGWVYSVRLLADAGEPEGARVEERARAEGICRSAPLPAGELLAVDAREYDRLVARSLEEDPWFTARGPAGDPAALEARRVGVRVATPELPANASMRQMVDALWRLPRDIVSDGYDAALEALAGQLPMTIHEFTSGTECFSWIVPERWSCREAYLETMDGRRLFEYGDHPLHVVSYSLPFEGVVSREELSRHLHVHPVLADAIPFIFKYYERDWGLCCTRELSDSLTDEWYRVVLRTDFSLGTLKVGEVVVPGESDESVVLCAHLCHPHMVNDDLSGVVVGMDVMRELARRGPGRFTYRFLIVPETIGSLAWLSRHESLIPRIRGGLFLEMLGLDQPLALQHSFAGDSAVDRCFALALTAAEPDGWTGPFRSIIGNDERQFNAPGVRVPMLSLSRVRRPSDPTWPYPEYHSSRDTPALALDVRLAGARDAVLRMLATLEADVTPVNRFPGELFCSRYGIHVDAYADPEGHRALFDIMYLIDGSRSISEIARELGISFESVARTVAELRRHDLVTT